MKQFMKRALALLLCGVLLCAALPMASAATAPDFLALLEGGNQNSQNVIYSVTDPIYYTAEVGRFVGDYAIYRDITEGSVGILDYKGNVVFPPHSGNLEPQKIIGENVFLARDGYLYDFQGNKLYENKAVGEIGLLVDGFTGETCGYWIGERDIDIGYGYRIVRDFTGRQETVTNIQGLYNGMITYWKDNGKRGLKMLFGEELLPCVYDQLYFLSGDTLLYWKDGECGRMQPDGTVLEVFEYDTVTLARLEERNDLIISKDEKYGVCTLDGQILIPTEYDAISRCDWYPFHYVGEIDGVSWLISEDEGLTFCGTRNFPVDTDVLFENVYFIPQGESAVVVNENNERLIPEDLAPWYNGKVGTNVLLQVLGEEGVRLYNNEMQLIAELPGEVYEHTDRSLALETVDSQGVTGVAVYNNDGELLHTIPNARLRLVSKECYVLQRDGRMAFASWDGTLLTDFIYNGANDVSSGWEGLRYPFFGVVRDGGTSQVFEIIDGRTGKNALGENCFVLGDAFLLPEGSYFAYYKDGKTGFARLTSREEPPFKDVPANSWYAKPATFCANAGLMNGTGNGAFSPKTAMTRAMLVQVLYSISGEKTESYGFVDVPEGKWYTDAVNWAAANGIVSGKGEGRFAPNDPITREQLVAILFKYASLYGASEGDLTILEGYSDADRIGQYARVPFAWAVENGMLSGVTATTLDPKGTATRAQIATILMRFVEYMAATP